MSHGSCKNYASILALQCERDPEKCNPSTYWYRLVCMNSSLFTILYTSFGSYYTSVKFYFQLFIFFSLISYENKPTVKCYSHPVGGSFFDCDSLFGIFTANSISDFGGCIFKKLDRLVKMCMHEYNSFYISICLMHVKFTVG